MRKTLLLLLLLLSGVFGQAPQPQSEEAERKRRVIEMLKIRPGDMAADVGCGEGFYTIPLARSVGPAGKVFAEDIDEAALSKLKEHLTKERLKNVEIVKGVEDDPKLPANRLDEALIVNAYHEMTAHEAMLRHILAALKPSGVFVLMEGISDIRENLSRDEQIKHHQLAGGLAKSEVEKAGFNIVELRDPFIEVPGNEDGKFHWWLIVARKPPKN